MSESSGDSPLFVFSPCVLCGQQDNQPVLPIDRSHPTRLSGFDITDMSIGVARCSKCGHEFIQPVPQPVFLAAYYASYMSAAKSGFYQERAASEIPERFRGRYEPWLSIIADLTGPKAMLLDIGAGLGMFLRLAKERGFAVEGVEPNAEAAAALQTHFHIPVINSLFEDAQPDDKVDALTMWDLLEHLANPRAALQKAASLLRPQGVLVLEIPARDSLLHSLAKLLFKASLGKIRRPLYLVCGVHHLHYFSEVSISRLLADTGFEVQQIRRGETELASLYRGEPGSRSAKTVLYNLALWSVFGLARFLRRQNKLIVFARKL